MSDDSGGSIQAKGLSVNVLRFLANLGIESGESFKFSGLQNGQIFYFTQSRKEESRALAPLLTLRLCVIL
jgi:hypothetical protein